MLDAKNILLDMLYPRRCPVCDEIVYPKSDKICTTCKNKLIYIKEPRCKKCSKPIMNEEQEFCFDCNRKHFSYIKGISLFEYNQVMKHSMSEFKFRSKKEYADFYVEEMLNHYTEWISNLNLDAILPVPIHKDKRRARGYNQAEILAFGLSKALHIPVLTDILIREKNTTPQKQLNDRERVTNLQHAFSVSENFKKNRESIILDKVLLVDDIYTTGTTIDVCTRVLQQYGVYDIYFMTVCIGNGY